MQIVQAVIIACIGIIAGMIISELVKTDRTVCTAMPMVLYGTIAVKTLKDGVCWYSASVLYVWPLLPLDFTEVKLQKLYDDTYANRMPYQEGYEFIEEWMKNYYELSNEVEFEWNSLNSFP